MPRTTWITRRISRASWQQLSDLLVHWRKRSRIRRASGKSAARRCPRASASFPSWWRTATRNSNDSTRRRLRVSRMEPTRRRARRTTPATRAAAEVATPVGAAPVAAAPIVVALVAAPAAVAATSAAASAVVAARMFHRWAAIPVVAAAASLVAVVAVALTFLHSVVALVVAVAASVAATSAVVAAAQTFLTWAAIPTRVSPRWATSLAVLVPPWPRAPRAPATLPRRPMSIPRFPRWKEPIREPTRPTACMA